MGDATPAQRRDVGDDHNLSGKAPLTPLPATKPKGRSDAFVPASIAPALPAEALPPEKEDVTS